MGTQRLEAFSDGVLAIIITIMVLEFKVPVGDHLKDLLPQWPIFLSYVLSFVYIGIYWNNHHHLMSSAEHVNGTVLWSNLHLLFWLSLIPFATAWMGENHFTTWPIVLYGLLLLMAGIAYYIMSRCLIRLNGEKSMLAQAVGKDKKGILSVIIYAAAIPLAFLNASISLIMYAVVAAIWFIPDKRIEKRMIDKEFNEIM